jgi:hypothetical protein
MTVDACHSPVTDIKPKEKPKKRTPTKAKAGASEPTTPAKGDANQPELQTPVKSTGADPATPVTLSTPQNSNINVPLSPTTPFELRETIGSATNAQVWMTRKEKPTDAVTYENLPQSVKLELWDLKCKVDSWISKDIVFYNTAAPVSCSPCNIRKLSDHVTEHDFRERYLRRGQCNFRSTFGIDLRLVHSFLHHYKELCQRRAVECLG